MRSLLKAGLGGGNLSGDRRSACDPVGNLTGGKQSGRNRQNVARSPTLKGNSRQGARHVRSALKGLPQAFPHDLVVQEELHGIMTPRDLVRIHERSG